MKTFQYKWYPKMMQMFLAILILAGISNLLSGTIWDVFSDPTTFFLTCLLVTGGGFLISYGRFLLERYELTDDSLVIIRPLLNSKIIAFQQIKRVIIRDSDYYLWGSNEQLTIFMNDGHRKKIILSALQDKTSFMQSLKNTNALKIIHQKNNNQLTTPRL